MSANGSVNAATKTPNKNILKTPGGKMQNGQTPLRGQKRKSTVLQTPQKNDKSPAKTPGADNKSKLKTPNQNKLSTPKETKQLTPNNNKVFTPKEKKQFTPKTNKVFTPKENKQFTPKPNKVFTPKPNKQLTPKHDKTLSPNTNMKFTPKHKTPKPIQKGTPNKQTPNQKKGVTPKKQTTPAHVKSATPIKEEEDEDVDMISEMKLQTPKKDNKSGDDSDASGDDEAVESNGNGIKIEDMEEDEESDVDNGDVLNDEDDDDSADDESIDEDDAESIDNDESDKDDDNESVDEDAPPKKRKLTANGNAEKLDNNTIWVQNLCAKIEKKTLFSIFEKYGRIVSLWYRKLFVQKEGKTTCAYIKYECRMSAVKALSENGNVCNNRHLRVGLIFGDPLKDHMDKNKTIFVRNLNEDADEEDLWRIFESCGKIVNTHVPMDKVAHVSRRIGFVNFESEDAVKLAMKLKPHMGGQQLEVTLAKFQASKNKKKNGQFKKPLNQKFQKPNQMNNKKNDQPKFQKNGSPGKKSTSPNQKPKFQKKIEPAQKKSHKKMGGKAKSKFQK